MRCVLLLLLVTVNITLLPNKWALNKFFKLKKSTTRIFFKSVTPLNLRLVFTYLILMFRGCHISEGWVSNCLSRFINSIIFYHYLDVKWQGLTSQYIIYYTSRYWFQTICDVSASNSFSYVECLHDSIHGSCWLDPLFIPWCNDYAANNIAASGKMIVTGYS